MDPSERKPVLSLKYLQIKIGVLNAQRNRPRSKIECILSIKLNVFALPQTTQLQDPLLMLLRFGPCFSGRSKENTRPPPPTSTHPFPVELLSFSCSFRQIHFSFRPIWEILCTSLCFANICDFIYESVNVTAMCTLLLTSRFA